MRQVIDIKPEWLIEIAPHYYKKKDIEDDIGKKMPKTVSLILDQGTDTSRKSYTRMVKKKKRRVYLLLQALLFRLFFKNQTGWKSRQGRGV